MKNRFSVFGLIVGLLFISQSLIAQQKKNDDPDPNKTYKYEVDSNDPANAPNLSFSIFPFYADIYTLNYNLGYGLQGDYRLNNKLNFNFSYRGAYLDRFSKSTDNLGQMHGYSRDEDKLANSYGFGLTYYFKNDLSDHEEEITLKTKHSGNTEINYVMDIPSKRLKLFGIRAGYEALNSSILSGNGNIVFEGTLVTPDNSASTNFSGQGPYSTYMKSGMITVGICRTKISDLHINVEQFGERYTAAVREVYFDVLYATGITFSDMLVSSSNTMGAITYHAYDVNATGKSKIGFRLGYSDHFNYKFKALGTFGMELGLRPGPKDGFDNFSLLLKFGMNLSVRAGAKQPTVE